MAPLPPAPTPVPPIASPPGPVPFTPYNSISQSSKDACEKRLEEMGVQKGSKIMARTVEPMQGQNDYPIQTNVFGIEKTDKDVIVHTYSVHIAADLSTSKTAVFTKKGNEDYVVVDRHEKCVNIFETVVSQNEDFFKIPQDNRIVYDGQALLFTTVDLFKGKGTRICLVVNGADTQIESLHNLPTINVEIFVGENKKIEYTKQNFVDKTANSDLTINDRSLAQLTELLINQKCKESSRFACFEHGKVYVLYPENEGYLKNDTMDVGDGKSLLPGFKKTVHFIEGPHGRSFNNPSLVVDAMKAAFHKEQIVVEKIMDLTQTDRVDGLMPQNFIDKCVPVIKGLHVHTNHTGKIQQMQIDGIHKDNALKTRFDLNDGKTTTVAEYYMSKYKIDLKFPNLNLLVCKHRGNKNFVPMELVRVNGRQRVSISQQTSKQSQLTTRQCAVAPADRTRLIWKGIEMLALAEPEKHDVLKDFGLVFYSSPLMVNAKILGNKELSYGGASVSTDKGKWRQPTKSYVRPADPVDVWAVYAVQSGRGMSDGDVLNFARKMMAEAKNRGLMFNTPAEAMVIKQSDVSERIKIAAKNGCKFVFMLTDSNITNLHSQYKLLEREHGIVVQDVTTKTARDVMSGKNQTMENILNKTNVKLGGLNYVVNDKLFTDDQLIIGVGQSAPPPSTKHLMEGKGMLNPTCIGYCSNVVQPQEFVGDFTLSIASQDTFVSMEEIITVLLNKWKTTRKTTCKRIVVYRTGSSEGAYGSILSLEVPLVREAISKCGFDCRLVYIVVSKEHNFRFFNGDINPMAKPTDQNIPSGVLLDKEVTNPSFKQFFLNSHRTLQGTAKTPSYTVLVDDFDAKMEKLELLTHSLCHHHQIVAMSTSLPSPLYIANEYAKRGRALWMEKIGSQPPMTSENDNSRLVELTNELGYRESNFANRRINA